jgi:hypothetical protein
LQEETGDFIVSERLRFKPLFILCGQMDWPQFSEEESELIVVIPEASAEKSTEILLGLLLRD